MDDESSATDEDSDEGDPEDEDEATQGIGGSLVDIIKPALLNRKSNSPDLSKSPYDNILDKEAIEVKHFPEAEDEPKDEEEEELQVKTRLKILPVLTREHYTSLLHWV
jgi:hypothetical protein